MNDWHRANHQSWARIRNNVDQLPNKTKLYNFIVQAALQITYARSVGSISTIQVAHVMVQSATDQARAITRHRRISLHTDIDMALASYDMSWISTIGWIEVPYDHLSDLMSRKDFPVPERCSDNQFEYAESQYNVVNGKKVLEAMDEESWKQEWLE
jgi:hypothetical protein